MSRNHETLNKEPLPPEAIKYQALSALERETFKAARTLVPQSDVSQLRISITSAMTDIGNVDTHEGASYNHVNRQVTIRFKPYLDEGFYTSSLSDDPRYVTCFSFAEICAAQNQLSVVFPELLRLLIARTVHEMLHGLTYELWSFTLDDIKHLPAEPTTDQEVAASQSLMGEIQAAYWSYSSEDTLPHTYDTAYRISLELVARILPLIPTEERQLFFRTAYLHGLSEIVSVMIEGKVKPLDDRSSVQVPYLSYYYVYQRLDLLFPAPTQHQQLLQILGNINLPISAQNLVSLKALGENQDFITFYEAAKLVVPALIE